jgi:hypothetical protein
MESLPYISNPALAGLQLAAGSFSAEEIISSLTSTMSQIIETTIYLAPQECLLPLDTRSQLAAPVIPDEAA